MSRIVRGTYYLPTDLRKRIAKIFRERYGTIRGSSRSRISLSRLICELLTAWAEREERKNGT